MNDPFELPPSLAFKPGDFDADYLDDIRKEFRPESVAIIANSILTARLSRLPTFYGQGAISAADAFWTESRGPDDNFATKILPPWILPTKHKEVYDVFRELEAERKWVASERHRLEHTQKEIERFLAIIKERCPK